MNDSLSTEARCFDGLRKSNVETLLHLLAELSVLEIDYLRGRYREHATDFDATVEALLELGVIVQDQAVISLKVPSKHGAAYRAFWTLATRLPI